MARMTGSRAFAEMMQGYGVSHVFFVPLVLPKGMAEMEDMPIRRIMTHGEKASAYMADGYARASGRPGVCLAQVVGGSNLAAGLRDACMNGTPIIAITGGATPQMRYRHAYQDLSEDFTQFGPVTKFRARVESVSRFPDLLRQAFREATSGAPGPVYLHVQGPFGDITEQEADLDPFVEPQFARMPAFRPEPDMECLRDVAARLAAAKRPVIVAGGGVVTSRAEREVVEFAEKMQIPVATSLNAKAVISDTHPLAVGISGLYSRDCANFVLHEADLVFFIGSHTGGQVTHGWRFPPARTPVIQLDIDPTELGRNYRNAASVLGDAKVSLRRLIDMAEAKTTRSAAAWTGRTQQLVAQWRAEHAPMLESDATPIRPERLCKEISDTLPPNGAVVSDTGHSGIWTGAMIALRHPTQGYFRCAGSLGWGLPGAIGVKCALPDRPVLCFTGDGGLYYHIAELETASRYGINIVVVVNNNSALNQEITIYDQAYGGKQRGRAGELWQFPDRNFAQIAEGFGCVGMRITDPQDLRGALEKAFTLDKPVVIDVVTDTYAFAASPTMPG
jgi:acetolactate synthase I/II/III large subunit